MAVKRTRNVHRLPPRYVHTLTHGLHYPHSVALCPVMSWKTCFLPASVVPYPSSRADTARGVCPAPLCEYGGLWRPVLTAPVSAVPALFATVRARPGAFRPFKTASRRAWRRFWRDGTDRGALGRSQTGPEQRWRVRWGPGVRGRRAASRPDR